MPSKRLDVVPQAPRCVNCA
ncbi:MAG: hypothetical protein MJE12_14785 [Alphaproteobacteria bacterium]|nr:hypothetical protein [Alphaproteobacteria bacterium]